MVDGCGEVALCVAALSSADAVKLLVDDGELARLFIKFNEEMLVMVEVSSLDNQVFMNFLCASFYFKNG
jgi:hypothetical protein